MHLITCFPPTLLTPWVPATWVNHDDLEKSNRKKSLLSSVLGEKPWRAAPSRGVCLQLANFPDDPLGASSTRLTLGFLSYTRHKKKAPKLVVPGYMNVKGIVFTRPFLFPPCIFQLPCLLNQRFFISARVSPSSLPLHLAGFPMAEQSCAFIVSLLIVTLL